MIKVDTKQLINILTSIEDINNSELKGITKKSQSSFSQSCKAGAVTVETLSNIFVNYGYVFKFNTEGIGTIKELTSNSNVLEVMLKKDVIKL